MKIMNSTIKSLVLFGVLGMGAVGNRPHDRDNLFTHRNVANLVAYHRRRNIAGEQRLGIAADHVFDKITLAYPSTVIPGVNHAGVNSYIGRLQVISPANVVLQTFDFHHNDTANLAQMRLHDRRANWNGTYLLASMPTQMGGAVNAVTYDVANHWRVAYHGVPGMFDVPNVSRQFSAMYSHGQLVLHAQIAFPARAVLVGNPTWDRYQQRILDYQGDIQKLQDNAERTPEEMRRFLEELRTNLLGARNEIREEAQVDVDVDVATQAIDVLLVELANGAAYADINDRLDALSDSLENNAANVITDNNRRAAAALPG